MVFKNVSSLGIAVDRILCNVFLICLGLLVRALMGQSNVLNKMCFEMSEGSKLTG